MKIHNIYISSSSSGIEQESLPTVSSSVGATGALRLSAFSILGVLRLSANFPYVGAHFTYGLPGEFNI